MVFLVEDSLAIRARLAATIKEIAGAELVGEAGSVGEAIEGIRSTHPPTSRASGKLSSGGVRAPSAPPLPIRQMRPRESKPWSRT